MSTKLIRYNPSPACKAGFFILFFLKTGTGRIKFLSMTMALNYNKQIRNPMLVLNNDDQFLKIVIGDLFSVRVKDNTIPRLCAMRKS